MVCGYSQIPGVNFSENHLLVVNDVTFRILILVLLVLDLKAKMVDMETAFLMIILKKIYSWSIHQELQMLKRMMSLH